MTQKMPRFQLLPPDALRNMRLGISASDSPDLYRLGLLDAHFRMALGELTRTVIIAGGTLYYGGHLEPKGITQFIIEELQRYGRRDKPLKVCLSWTVHRKMTLNQIAEQTELLGLFGEIHFLNPEGNRMDQPSSEHPQELFSFEERAKALSSLRKYMASNTDARIVIGGKLSGYEGSMPGIIEEVLNSIQLKQPLYLAGGFGGATLEVIRKLRPPFADWLPKLPEATQLDQKLLNGLAAVGKAVSSQEWDGYNNGLSEEENILLAASYRSSEIAALVGKGLGRLLIG